MRGLLFGLFLFSACTPAYAQECESIQASADAVHAQFKGHGIISKTFGGRQAQAIIISLLNSADVIEPLRGLIQSSDRVDIWVIPDHQSAYLLFSKDWCAKANAATDTGSLTELLKKAFGTSV